MRLYRRNTLPHSATDCNTHTATRGNTQQRQLTVLLARPFTISSGVLTLIHPATRCNTLQHAATHCNTLQHTATRCNTLQHPDTPCNTLQHSYCNTLQQHPQLTVPLARQWTPSSCAATHTLQHTAAQHTATTPTTHSSIGPTFCYIIVRAATHCNTLQHTTTTTHSSIGPTLCYIIMRAYHHSLVHFFFSRCGVF